MDRDFFIKLAFGTHRVAGFLKEGKQVREHANDLLTDLLLFCEDNPVTIEQKRNILPRTLRKIDALQNVLNNAKGEGGVDPKNFLILEKEYAKIPGLLIAFLESQKPVENLTEPSLKKEAGLSERQKKILEVMQGREKTQVWELQKVLPEVTKRTLRRDVDDLLKLGLIERQGEWNNVFYRIKK